MNTLVQRKYLLAAGILFSMLFFMLQVRPIVRMSTSTMEPSTGRSSWRAAVHHARKTVVHMVEKHVAKVIPAAPPAELMALHLKSNIREYNYIFSGQTFCGQQPCAARLDLLLDSSRNPNMHRTIETMEDGTFWFQVPLTEVAHEQADWKLVAHTQDGQTAETHGRRILMEDPVVSVEANLTLR